MKCLHKASKHSSTGLLIVVPPAESSAPRLPRCVDFKTVALVSLLSLFMCVNMFVFHGDAQNYIIPSTSRQPAPRPVCLERRDLRLQPQLQCEQTGFQINEEQITNIYTVVATNNTTRICGPKWIRGHVRISFLSD